jgi:membrane protein DedA with SNARE-associated domain
MIHLRQSWIRGASLALAVVAALATAWFGMRSYRTYVLLQSAYEAGLPKSSAIRGWMTLRYVAAAYRIPETRLLERLGLPAATAPDTALRTLAKGQGVPVFRYVKQVQRSVADIAPRASSAGQSEARGGFDWFNDRVLSALLRYGYAVLGLTLLLSAIGLPLPGGLATALAGSQAAAGSLNWLAAGMVAVVACVLGDVIVYGLGRLVSERFLARRGRWFGLTAGRQAGARKLFERWGGMTVLITRTLVSNLSSIVSVLAGVSRYRAAPYLGYAVAGRAIWAGAYLGLGYAIGGDLEAATDFLKNLTGLLVSAPILAGSALVAAGRIKVGATGTG